MTVQEMKDARTKAWLRMAEILAPEAENSKEALVEYDQLERSYEQLTDQIDREEFRTPLRVAASAGDNRAVPISEAVLPQEKRYSDWVRDNEPQAQYSEQDEILKAEGFDFRSFIRGLDSGDFGDYSPELRTLISQTGGSAGFNTVPTPLAVNVLDEVRNKAQVAQAGASFIPMATSTLKLAKVASSPAGQDRAELDVITEEDITIGVVTLTATNVATLVKASREFLEDTSNFGAAQIQGIIAEKLALRIDSNALYGTGIAPVPTGLHVHDDVGIAAPLVLTSYDFLIDGIGTLNGVNIEPNAFIYSPADKATLAKLKTGIASDKTTLVPPPEWTNMKRLTTNQVTASDGFLGRWSDMLWGVRSTISIRLDERYAETLEVGFVVNIRYDIQLARPSSFVVSGHADFV